MVGLLRVSYAGDTISRSSLLVRKLLAFTVQRCARTTVRGTLIVLALLAPAAVEGQQSPPARRPVPVADSARVRVAVGGMSCSSCAVTIKAMLRRTTGVRSATVSYDRGEAVVEYDPKKTTPASIVAVIKKLGYSAQVKS
jgi:periplasmic mercuric ion binding protein